MVCSVILISWVRKKASQNLRLKSCQRVWWKPRFYWVQSWRSWRHSEASTVLGHIIQAQELLWGKGRLLEAASTMICGDLSLHGGLTLPPPRPTLLSPSMTMTGTAVAGQRCLAGRGLSQFHRTMIWKGQGSLDGCLGYSSRSASKGSACRNDLVKLHFKVSPHPYTLQTMREGQKKSKKLFPEIRIELKEKEIISRAGEVAQWGKSSLYKCLMPRTHMNVHL